jgi:uncharacterized protein (TIGR02757 family)
MQEVPLSELHELLERAVDRFQRLSFIEADPIMLPHRFGRLQDREIIGFWVSMIAWGQRKSIISNGLELCRLMEEAPYDFIMNHQESDRGRFQNFFHRTFQYTDSLYFLDFLQRYYRSQNSLEDAFFRHMGVGDLTIESGLVGFHRTFFDHPYVPNRTRKHVSTPLRGSTCKRLNMFLRWMVRTDPAGVDFGIWNRLSPAQLMIPLDVHVDRVARVLGLLGRPKTDWRAVVELTDRLREFSPTDPVRYDYALFGLGVLDKPTRWL